MVAGEETSHNLPPWESLTSSSFSLPWLWFSWSRTSFKWISIPLWSKMLRVCESSKSEKTEMCRTLNCSTILTGDYQKWFYKILRLHALLLPGYGSPLQVLCLSYSPSLPLFQNHYWIAGVSLNSWKQHRWLVSSLFLWPSVSWILI